MNIFGIVVKAFGRGDVTVLGFDMCSADFFHVLHISGVHCHLILDSIKRLIRGRKLRMFQINCALSNDVYLCSAELILVY